MAHEPDLGHPLRLLAQGEVPRVTGHADVMLVHPPYPSAECGMWNAEYRGERLAANEFPLLFRTPHSALRTPHSAFTSPEPSRPHGARLRTARPSPAPRAPARSIRARPRARDGRSSHPPR